MRIDFWNIKATAPWVMPYLSYMAMMLIFAACGGEEGVELPIYGRRNLDDNGDTVYHTIGDFSLTNQNGETITEEDFLGKVYVSDFFFTNCPSICPATTGQKLRIYERFQDNPDFLLLSHTVDPKRDSVGTLKEFAENLGVESTTWHFATGEQEYLYNLGLKSYLLPAQEDPEAPGGYLHGDKFMLIDRKGRIRGAYSGTNKAKVDQLMEDAEKLLNQKPQE